tara:strand:- start:1783 stop:1932 length:150 start_codon:yes stop_codon:yes gene_type:complete
MQVDESVRKEHIGKSQSDFLNWLQNKLEEEMKKPSFKNYKPQGKVKKNV